MSHAIYDEDFRLAAHRAAMGHLEECFVVLDAIEAGEEVSSPASAPFCGCDDCTIREVLFAAFPIFRAGILESRSDSGGAS